MHDRVTSRHGPGYILLAHEIAMHELNRQSSQPTRAARTAHQRSHFLDGLTGRVFLSQDEAFSTLVAAAEAHAAPPEPGDPWMARGLI